VVGPACERAGNAQRDNLTTQLFRLMGRNTIRTIVDKVTVNWPTFHTQGMVKIGEILYVSSLEVISSTIRNGIVGGIVHNLQRRTLHGVSWGSRRMYTWRISGNPKPTKVVSSEWTPNAQFYIDYWTEITSGVFHDGERQSGRSARLRRNAVGKPLGERYMS
jgi:Family of unknown function (DUF6454)